MPRWLRENLLPFVFALGLHAVLIAVLIVGLDPAPAPRVDASGTKQVRIVQARAVRERDIEAEMRRIRERERRRRARERARQRRLQEQARRARLARLREQRRLAALKKRQAEQRRRLRQQREREAALRRRRQAEQRRLAELERRRREQEKAIEARRRRLAEIRRRQAEAARKAREEAARKRREAEMRRAMEAEERARRAARRKQLLSLRQKYMLAIHDAVKRRWRRPPSVRKGDTCVVLVRQIPGGEVVSVNVTKCTGNAVAFQRSVRTAVLKASPLPPPPDPAVFDRDIRFTFNPEN